MIPSFQALVRLVLPLAYEESKSMVRMKSTHAMAGYIKY